MSEFVGFRVPKEEQEISDTVKAIKEQKGSSKELFRIFKQGLEVESDQKCIRLPLPDLLPDSVQSWLSQPESQFLLGSWIYQMLVEQRYAPASISGVDDQGALGSPERKTRVENKAALHFLDSMM